MHIYVSFFLLSAQFEFQKHIFFCCLYIAILPLHTYAVLANSDDLNAVKVLANLMA